MGTKKNVAQYSKYSDITTQTSSKRTDRHRSLIHASRASVTAPRSRFGLQLWPEDTAGLPSRLTRTALFGLPRRGRRRWYKEEPIISGSDVKVFYTGEQLDQKDLEVWLMLLMAFQGQDEDYMLQTRMSHMLKTLKRSVEGGSRQALTSSLKRLTGASVYIKYRSGTVEGVFNFLHGVAWNSRTQEISIKLGRDLGSLFDVTAFLDFDAHLLLPSQMAKAVHKYAVGNKRGKLHSVPLNKLKKLLGYEGEIKEFRKTLGKALVELESSGMLQEPRITGGIVRWILNKL